MIGIMFIIDLSQIFDDNLITGIIFVIVIASVG